MTNATISVCPRQLLASLLFAGKKDVRYYLNGVQVHATETETQLHVSQGHVAAFLTHPAVNGMAGCYSFAFIVPRSVIERAKANLAKAKHAHVLLDAGAYPLDVDGVSFPFTPVDGKMINMRQIMPEQAAPGEAAAQFDPELLVLFAKAAKVLVKGGKGSSVNVHHAGADRAAAITLWRYPLFAGVIMPLRPSKDPAIDTGWAREPMAAPVTEAAAA